MKMGGFEIGLEAQRFLECRFRLRELVSLREKISEIIPQVGSFGGEFHCPAHFC